MKKRPFDKCAQQRLNDMAYEVSSIITLVRDKVTGISSDDDILEVDEDSATWSYALEGAKRIAEGIAEEIGMLDTGEAESEEAGSKTESRVLRLVSARDDES